MKPRSSPRPRRARSYPDGFLHGEKGEAHSGPQRGWATVLSGFLRLRGGGVCRVLWAHVVDSSISWLMFGMSDA